MRFVRHGRQRDIAIGHVNHDLAAKFAYDLCESREVHIPRGFNLRDRRLPRADPIGQFGLRHARVFSHFRYEQS